MVQDPEYEHLKLEKKCCDQGCLAGGLLFDPSLRPIVSKAKRLKTEALATGNQTTVPLHGHNRGGSRLVNEKIHHDHAAASQGIRVQKFRDFVADELPALYHLGGAPGGAQG